MYRVPAIRKSIPIGCCASTTLCRTLNNRRSRNDQVPREQLRTTTQEADRQPSHDIRRHSRPFHWTLLVACCGSRSACPSGNHGEGDKRCGGQQPEKRTSSCSGKSPSCVFRKDPPRQRIAAILPARRHMRAEVLNPSGLTRSSPLRAFRAVDLLGLHLLKHRVYAEGQREEPSATRTTVTPSLNSVDFKNAMGSKLESGWITERGASKHGTVAPNDHHRTTQAPALGAATVYRDIVTTISGF